jgi:hypothetical protein
MFLLVSAALAAPIQWSDATDITGPSVVQTVGTTLEAENLTPLTTADAVVNGVTFTSSVDLFGATFPNTPLDGITTGDVGLDRLLGGFDNARVPFASFDVGDGQLQVGTTYLVQVFYTDLRGTGPAREMSFGDGLGNVVAVDGLGADPGTTTFGQVATGLFVADGADQTLTIDNTGWSANAHITAYQVRELAFGTVVTDPMVAGEPAEIRVAGVAPGDTVFLTGKRSLGAYPVPGCPGTTMDLRRPLLLGAEVADADGIATFTIPQVPNFTGLQAGLQSAVVTSCSVGPLLWTTIE